MGAWSEDDTIIVERISRGEVTVPYELKLYLTHHLRNELQNIQGRLLSEYGRDSKIYKSIKEHINHIYTDLKIVGI